jgi:threonine-phosphate decarboxylase
MDSITFDRLHGGDAPAGVLDFSASINPLGPPAAALAAYHAAASSIASYPPPYCERLAAGIAQWLHVEAGNVIAGNGSTHLIHLLARALRPLCPFVATPTFSEIANALLIAGITPHSIPLLIEDGFVPDRAGVIRALELGADALFIGRPNSPTGSMVPRDEAAAIAEECARRKCWCVFDEAFIDFAGDSESVVALVRHLPTVIVLRSLTKILAIPGLRLGFTVAAPPVIAKLRGAMEPWSVNVVAERVGLDCLGEVDGFAARTRALISNEREYLTAGLSAISGVRVCPSAANFLMLQVTAQPVAGKFRELMLGRGVAVRDLRTLPGCGAGFYRIAIRTRAENERLLAAARDCLGAGSELDNGAPACSDASRQRNRL